LGPLTVRYHAISMAAVFVALGIGIIVGSNTNFLGIRSLIERQDTVISKLEANYKEIRKEVSEARDNLQETRQYVDRLETMSIPLLLAGKLDGLRVGVVVIGESEGSDVGEEPLLARFKSAGAIVSYKMRTSLPRLEEMSIDHGTGFINEISKELLEGTQAGSKYTDTFITEGILLSGGFEKPVGGVIFILGDDLKLDLLRRLVLPIEAMMQNNGGLVINVTYSENRNYRNIFRANHLSYYQDAAGLPGQIEAISGLSEMFLQHKERIRSGS